MKTTKNAEEKEPKIQAAVWFKGEITKELTGKFINQPVIVGLRGVKAEEVDLRVHITSAADCKRLIDFLLNTRECFIVGNIDTEHKPLREDDCYKLDEEHEEIIRKAKQTMRNSHWQFIPSSPLVPEHPFTDLELEVIRMALREYENHTNAFFNNSFHGPHLHIAPIEASMALVRSVVKGLLSPLRLGRPAGEEVFSEKTPPITGSRIPFDSPGEVDVVQVESPSESN